jgi:carboxylesterase type B
MANTSNQDKARKAKAYVEVHGRKVQGFISASGVGNFLGIPYGKIPERFFRSQLIRLETLDADLDATAYGPRCPQGVNFQRRTRLHLYEGIQPLSEIPQSEYHCLNLNIYTPAKAITANVSQLPVLVWIHGGGWVFGDGSWEYGWCHDK